MEVKSEKEIECPELDALLEPYVKRVEQLEESINAKEVDIVLLKHAVNDMIGEISTYKGRLQRLPKSDLIRQVRQGARADREMGQAVQAGEAECQEVSQSALTYLKVHF